MTGNPYFYIQSAMRKIEVASVKGNGVRLTIDEVFALGLSHELGEAFQDFDSWRFDENRELIDDITDHG